MSTTPSDPVSTVQTAVSGMGDQLLEVAGVGLGIGVLLFVVKKGWALVRSFAH